MSALRFPHLGKPPNLGDSYPQAQAKPGSFGQLVGGSSVMRVLCERIERVAATSASVLLVGEVGTEKELVAQSIHNKSPWRANPFVVVKLARLNPDLVMDTLFGSVSGSPKNAEINQGGLLVAADGGTLFLDDLDEACALAQVGLLRALDRGEIMPVGGTVARKVSVRVVAGATCDRATAINEIRIRGDLRERLSVGAITIPPLRDRVEDIPVLAEQFLRSLGIEDPTKVLLTSTVASLQIRPWLENVSELQGALQHALMKAGCGPLSIDLFPSPLAHETGVPAPLQDLVKKWVQQFALEAETEPSDLYRELINVVEEALIAEVLKQRGGGIFPAARWLGLSRATVRKLVCKYHLRAVEEE